MEQKKRNKLFFWIIVVCLIGGLATWKLDYWPGYFYMIGTLTLFIFAIVGHDPQPTPEEKALPSTWHIMNTKPFTMLGSIGFNLFFAAFFLPEPAQSWAWWICIGIAFYREQWIRGYVGRK